MKADACFWNSMLFFLYAIFMDIVDEVGFDK